MSLPALSTERKKVRKHNKVAAQSRKTMRLLDWLFGEDKPERRKKIFISFSMKDVEYRNHLVNQAKNKKSPFEFLDYSVK